MYQQAVKTDNKVLLENKGKFMLIHSSSGFKHSLKGEFFENVAFEWFFVYNMYTYFFLI